MAMDRTHKIALNVTMHIKNPGGVIKHAAQAVKRRRQPDVAKMAARDVARGLGIVRLSTEPSPS